MSASEEKRRRPIGEGSKVRFGTKRINGEPQEVVGIVKSMMPARVARERGLVRGRTKNRLSGTVLEIEVEKPDGTKVVVPKHMSVVKLVEE